MFCIYIVLFCIIHVLNTNGAWIQTTISMNEHAKDLAHLGETFWSLKPVVFQNEGPLVLCQFIDEYCTTETNRMQAISLMTSSIVNEYRSKKRYNQVLTTCMNSTTLENVQQSSPLIHRMLSPMITQRDKHNIIQHRKIIMNYFTELNDLLNYMNKSCNAEEIHALLCLSNTELLITCVQKILQDIYEKNNSAIYEEFIEKTKEILVDLNTQLLQLSTLN
ncbi:hypothetical protein I4U23_020369 [Adineta vaga]|nr:hypothetical protein I4U23_020369 [Adineta vaga]